ncbi:MAG: serine hydrolase [Bacteroidota bacterium]
MKKILSIIALFCFFSITLFSQETKLELNNPIEKSLKLGEKHVYVVEAEADKYLFAVVLQDGIDLTIAVYGPDDEKVGDFDSPNYQHGPEYISFNTTATGTYRFEIEGFEGNQPEDHVGDYKVEWLNLEPIPTTPEGRIDQLFFPWNRKGSPGASVAVMKDGEIIFSKGYGEAQLEYNIPIDPNSIFHIASISKQFTAYCMAKLADEGKLSLDDPIQKHLPEMADFGKTITIKHLIYHTSGLRDQWNLLAMAGWRLDDVITKGQVLRLMSRQTALNFEPGAEYLYCNSGYTLMAEIVERVTEKTFPEWTEENIFEPLGMTNTLFFDDHEKIVPNRTYSFSESGSGFRKRVLSYANAGATSLFTTPEDLLKWAHSFSKPIAGNEKVMEQMQERGVLTKGDTITYAFGQVLGEWKGLKTWSHGGADAGFRTYMVRFPDQNINIAVFSNLGSFNPGQKAYEIAEIYLEEHIEQKPTSKEKAETAEAEETNTVEIDIEILEAYNGKYEIAPGFILTISSEDSQLFGQATGQGRFPLTPNSTTEFGFADAGIKIVFERNDDNSIPHLTLYQGANVIECKRMKDFDADGVDLKAYEGDYYSEELLTTYMLRVEDGKLVAKHQRHDNIGLTPTKEDHFSGNVWFMGQIEFTRDGENISGMKVSNGRVKNLVFGKE